MGVLQAVDDDPAGHVTRALAEYFDSRQAQVAEIGQDFAAAVEVLREFVLGGGKRIRPTFAWWGWRGAGGAAEGPQALAALRALSALELLQASALIHDDLMDSSATRRGAPTVHVRFAAQHREHRWHGTPEQFGLAAAVLLGDIALAWTDDMFASAGLPFEALTRAVPPWQAMRVEVLAGQYIDVRTQASGDESVEAALRIDRFKTAAYTVERPLHLGAALGGASQELIEAYRAFGAEVGIAFQLRDDLLGVFGDPEVTGKPAGDDLREGKRTLLVALGIEHAQRAGRYGDVELLRACLGRDGLDTDDVGKIRDLLVEVGAVAAVEHRIAELTGSALARLRAAPMPELVADRLAELTVAATTRNR
ncbi:MAG TPA: polyprenyl synthetase family protein [Pseudonocardiaceae bacterium]|nr:polyprenyl synthetase family protein [Pseudonocardiaceae bacterium]